MKTYKILRIKNNNWEEVEDLLTEEISVAIEVNDTEIVTLLCSNTNLDELAVGYLFSSGIIKGIDDITDISIIPLLEKKWLASIKLRDNLEVDLSNFVKIQNVGCGKGSLLLDKSEKEHSHKLTSQLKVKGSTILSLMKIFQRKSEVFQQTGCVHSAGIIKDEVFINFREDIGRHNAVDKVIGNLVISNSKFDDKIIMSSGRISSDILYKVKKTGIPIIVTKSAPTDSTVSISRDANITLIGFVRANKMNIYSSEHRINQ